MAQYCFGRQMTVFVSRRRVFYKSVKVCFVDELLPCELLERALLRSFHNTDRTLCRRCVGPTRVSAMQITSERW